MTRLVYMPGVCRECGCDDEHACVGDDGVPCHWVEPDLCSTCAPSGVGEDLVDEYPYDDDGESPILARTTYDAIRRSGGA